MRPLLQFLKARKSYRFLDPRNQIYTQHYPAENFICLLIKHQTIEVDHIEKPSKPIICPNLNERRVNYNWLI